MRGLASLTERKWDDTGKDGAWFSAAIPDAPALTERGALALSAVWACQTLIADAIATLPFDVYRKVGSRREEVAPPAWLTKPNPETLRVDYETQRLLSLLGWGNAYSILVRKYGSADPMDPVVERWALDPSHVQVLRDPNGRLGYSVNGVGVPAGMMQHVRGYTHPGSVLGMSVIGYARRSLGLTAAADTFGESFFTNGIAPSGVLEVPALPAETSKDVVNRIRENFAERYAGTGNARKPLVLTGGTRWSQITINPVDAQFLDTRMFQIEEIARFYRVPLHEIQRITNNASQGGGQGIEAQSQNLAQRTLLPWTVRLEQSDSELLPRGQYEKLNLNAFVRADIKTRHEVYAIRRNIGVSNADEIRELEDEEPIPNGEGAAYWRPANMIEVGSPTSDLAPTPGDPMPPDPSLDPNVDPNNGAQ